MFSVIVMITFSVSLMANNNANQELIVLTDPDCEDAAYDAMNWAESEGLSDSDTITVMNWAYAICWLRQNSDRGWF